MDYGRSLNCAWMSAMRDKTDLRFFTFADAALYRNCGDHFAATPPKSRKRSLPSGFEDLFQTELSLLVA